MPKKSINDIRVPTYDDLFTNEEQRQEAKLEKIMEVPVEHIQEFKNHPFRVRNDEQMSELVKSVSEAVNIPVTACGGAAGIQDLKQVLHEGKAHAAAAGSMFVFYGRLKAVLITVPSENELFTGDIYH